MTNNFDLKIKKVFYPKDNLHLLSKEQLLDIVENGFVNYWLASKFICEKLGGRLPTRADLAKIASAIYEGNPSITPTSRNENLTYKDGTAISLGLPEPSFYLWSGEESDSDGAYYRDFYPTGSLWTNGSRGYSGIQAVCLEV